MSAPLEPAVDLVAVACVVESSILLASEWSRVLGEYVYPLFKRLNELHPSHQFRLAFVTYGAADTRPIPLISKRYFAPLSQVAKELKEDPKRFGIGQTGSSRLSALEGLVAAIELFDLLMMSCPNFTQTQLPQKENRSLISHLLHIAATPPDAAQRPFYNTLQHLDTVNWDSIPVELKKRKINLSLISLRKIPQFQTLQSVVAGPTAQSPWFNVRAPHILSLAGFPTPQKTTTKRQTDAPVSDHSPEKRQKLVPDIISRASPVSPALSSARTPQNQNQRLQQPDSPQVSQLPPATVSGQNSASAPPVQAATSVSASTPANATPAAPAPPSVPPLPPFMNPQLLEQVVIPKGPKFGQMIERLKVLEKEIQLLDQRISAAQNAGQAAFLAALQKDRTPKAALRDQIKVLLRTYYQKMAQAKEAMNSQGAGSASQNGPAEAGPLSQPQPPNAPSASSERPMGSTTEEHKPTISDSQQMLTQLWQSRGGTVSVPNGGVSQASPGQVPSYLPDAAARSQKQIENMSIRPPSFGASSQPPGATTHEAGTSSTPNATNGQPVPARSTWQGTFSSSFLKVGGQVVNELQIHAIGAVRSPAQSDIRLDTWPKNFALKPCKEPLKDKQELSSWLKRYQSRVHLMQFRPNPYAVDGSANEQKFQALNKFMAESGIYAYIGWQMPSGKFSYNILIFSANVSSFAGALFPEGLPDLPGNGNTLNAPPSTEEAQLPPLHLLNLHPSILAHLRSLDPEKRKQFLVRLVRAQQQQQDQLRRQQLQQAQQPPAASSQASTSLETSIPPNLYQPVGNIPPGVHANVNAPMNAGGFNTGPGTVNYEMMQSFMQRSVEGSTPQGSMNPG